MGKGFLRRLAGYLRDLRASGKAYPPPGDGPGDRRMPRLTVIEGGKGTPERDGNERRKPCAVIGIPYSSDAAENTVTREEESVMKNLAKFMFTVMAVAVAAMTLVACGGGGGGTSSAGGTTGTAVVTTGTMTKGSLIVNGIRFEDTAANISADDTTKTAAFLQSGMTVKVKGRRNDDGVSGTADQVEVENEVRGTVGNKGADNFTVLGQTVFVDGGTVFANVANFAALANGDAVEVHGSRDSTGAIRATRVEKLNTNPLGDELKGVVETKTGTTSGTFTITGSSLTFTYDTGTVLPDGMFAVGELVEVHLSGSAATRIEREDVEDNEFEPAEGQEFEVEGYVTGFTVTPGTFQVGGQSVQTTSSTEFEGGVSADLANDVKVEAEGHMVGGVLVADEIKFKDAVRFEANIEAVGGSGVSPDNVTVLGRTVFITSRTLASPIGGSFQTGEGVRIRAFLNQDNRTFTATRIEEDSNTIDPDKIIIQGLVISSTNPTIVLVHATNGFTVVTSAATSFRGDDDVPFPGGGTAFFGALRAGQTVVKAKGTYVAGILTANEVEIE